jgi:aspartyl-tRNA(Asn)/glutamyl-tRNA(Gln) amidotransferase subunit B
VNPEIRIGLEVHAQLRTRTKLFCACPSRYGGEPNSRICEVCLGLPGALPVLNREAVRLGILAAAALGSRIHATSSFARKHYFYPDLPRGYQITQHRHPLATGGTLAVRGDPAMAPAVGIRRIHLEEDSARSLAGDGEGAVALDFNRAGVPLIEIVTEPRIATPADARALLVALRRILEYPGICDCNMEEGSLRVDANVSVAGADGGPGERTEIKNLNSFGNVERALRFEIERQVAARVSGSPSPRQTRRWDARAGATVPLRDKEETADYRYLEDPDLPPVRVDEAEISAARDALPESAEARADRLRAEFPLASGQAESLTATPWLAERFERLVRAGIEAPLAAGWLLGEEMSRAGMHDASGTARIPEPRLAALLELLQSERITRAQARDLADLMLESGRTAGEAMAEAGIVGVASGTSVREWAEQVIAENAAEADRYRAGEHRLLDHFVGQAMRRSRGSADPATLRAALIDLLGA